MGAARLPGTPGETEAAGLTSSPAFRPEIPATKIMLSTINALSVRTSLGLAPAGLGRRASDSPSMRSHGLPDRQNVRRRILVTIVDGAASLARPFSDGQRKALDYMAAAGACLARREPAVDFYDRLPIACGLFLQHACCLPDAGVRNRAGEAVVLQHPAQVQILNADRIEASHHAGAKFVQCICASVGDFLVDTRNVAFRYRSAFAAFLAARKAFLVEGESPLPCGAVFWIRDPLAGAQGRQAAHPEVDTDGGASFGKRDWSYLYHKRDEEFSRSRADQANRRWMRDCLARPAHLEGADLGDLQDARRLIERKSALTVVGRLPRVFAFESWVGCALGEEIRESNLKIAQRLLKADARYLIQPRRLRLLLARGQRLVGRGVAYALPGPKGIGSFTQRLIPYVAHAAERPVEVLRLLWRRIAAEFPSGLHASHFMAQ